jgi:hypothetical protein
MAEMTDHNGPEQVITLAGMRSLQQHAAIPTQKVAKRHWRNQ